MSIQADQNSAGRPVLSATMNPIYEIELRTLQRRVDELEKRSGLMSPKFMTRAFTVWGYVLATQLIVALVVGGLMFALSFCLSTVSMRGGG